MDNDGTCRSKPVTIRACGRLLALAVLLALWPATAGAAGPTTTSSTLLPAINAVRWADGEGPLVVDPALEQVAMDRMHYLAARSTPGYDALSHCVDVREGITEDCRSGLEAARRLPRGIWWGENIALLPPGTPLNDGAARAWALRLWWTSPPHRANTLGRHFTRIGTAELRLPSGAIVYGEVFTS